MFEKDANLHASIMTWDEDVDTWETIAERSFKDGADFGYNKAKEELKDAHKESVETQNKFIIQLQKELEEERKLNAEIKARFVKCNTCTDEMKSKCLMFTENLCEGERCEELIDIVSLVNKSDLERKIEELEKANEWHYVKDEKDLPTDKKEYLLLLGSGIRTFGFYNGRFWESWKGDFSWQEVKAYFFVPVPELKESE